jgi:transcription initiation factor TFIIIB Brf1 subunit/transcription initiation factor TFIIB
MEKHGMICEECQSPNLIYKNGKWECEDCKKIQSYEDQDLNLDAE